MLKTLQQYGFIYGIVIVITLAVWHSQSVETAWVLDESYKWSLIAVIFGFQGLGLSKEALSQSHKPIQLPIFVLSWNFIGFPLVTFGLISVWMNPISQMGFFFLSIVPTTIALSVAYTDLSGGRVAGALLTTCLSNLIGALFVPLAFITFYGVSSGAEGQFGAIIEKIVWMLLLPVGIGYCLRHYLPVLGRVFLPIKKYAVEVLLLILIYSAFVDCFAQELASEGFIWSDFFGTIFLSFLLFVLISFLVWKSSKRLKFDRATQIAGFFTASQKSICSGIPLILLTISNLGQESEQAMILLPLIAYYFFQSTIGAYISHHFKQIS